MNCVAYQPQHLITFVCTREADSFTAQLEVPICAFACKNLNRLFCLPF
jgi:hypothetical protein